MREKVCYSVIKEKNQSAGQNKDNKNNIQIKKYFREEAIMTGTVKNYATASIFGSYILRMREIPGRKIVDELKEKKAERERFEAVDDYVEQA